MITLTDLRAEAAAEVRRLAAARALIQDGDEDALGELQGDGTWIAFPRRSRVRRALAGRICLVWRVAFEDASGRCVEARLVALLVHTNPALFDQTHSRRDRIHSLLRETEDEIRARAEAACDEWASAARDMTHAFLAARLAREEAIRQLPRRSQAPPQRGLFDRRSEREQQARVAIDNEDEETSADRMRSIIDRGAITRQPARLLLVLVP